MAKQAVATAERPSPFLRVRDFFQEVRVEMLKVAWPSRDELKQSTQVVMILLGIIGGIIFVYDIIFKFVVLEFLRMLG